MLTRLHRLWTARLAVAIFLFAQGVTAWSACDWLESSPYRAVLAAAEVAPCHESGFGGACLTHCLSDRQVVQKVSVDVPVMPAAPVLTLVLAVGEVQYLGPAPVPTSAAGASPPRRILLQSFQI
jgi:hypothetical protein